MRQSHSFLLTVIIPDDAKPDEIRGRVQFISTGHEAFFTDLVQLAKFLRSEVQEYQETLKQQPEALPKLKKSAASNA